MTSKAAIAAWLASYQSDLLGRELEPAERMLTEEVLLDFLLDEQWLHHRTPVDDVQHALDLLRGMVESEATAAFDRVAVSLMARVTDLQARLSRQEHANLVMREHLTMLSTPPTECDS